MIVALLVGIVLMCLSLFYKPNWLYTLLGIAAFGLYFQIPGEDYLLYIIFLLGVFMLIVELYVPDFGLIGLLGFAAITLSLWFYLNDIQDLLLTILAMVAVCGLSVVLMLRLGGNLSISRGMVLNTSFVKDKGYSSSKDYSFLVGRTGRVETPLRPVGRATVDGAYYDVISTQESMYPGTAIVVVKVEGSKIYVRKEVSNEFI